MQQQQQGTRRESNRPNPRNNMDEYIPSRGFFTPKRPSFKVTPPQHPLSSHNNSYSNGTRNNMYSNTPVSHHHHHNNHRRAYCAFQSNMTPPFVDDHRRMYSHGGGYHHHNQRQYYQDRYDRTPENGLYYSNRLQNSNGGHHHQIFGNYGGFPHGIFTTPPTSARGNREKRGKQKLEMNGSNKADNESGQGSSIDGGQGSCTSSLEDSADTSPTNSREGGVGNGGSSDDGNGGDGGCDTGNGNVMMSPFLEPQQQQQQQREYDPVGGGNGNYQQQQQQQNQVFLEPGAASASPSQVGTPLSSEPPAYNMHYHQCVPPPPLSMEQVHAFHHHHPIHPGFLHCVTANNQQQQQHHHQMAMYSNGASYKLMEAARTGYNQFQKDFHEMELQSNQQQTMNADLLEQRKGAKDENSEQEGKLQTLHKLTSTQIDFKNVMFGVDGRHFIDKRPTVSLVEDGEKQYKLFEEDMKPIREFINQVYNVNDVDPYDPREICCMKVLPQTIQRWPLEIIGTTHNWANLKRSIVNFTGGFGSCGVLGDEGNCASDGEEDRGNGIGSYGVRALANFFASCQGGNNYPLGFATFVGMNVDKLIRDLDVPRPLVTHFAGPLADRNHVLPSVDVISGFPEYNLPFEPDGGNSIYRDQEAYHWAKRIRVTRKMFILFSFEILLYIFYTFTTDAMQLLAASELYRRGWRFHKVFQIWITPLRPDGFEDAAGITEHGEWLSGYYKFFHYGKWEFAVEYLKINECVLEGRPQDYYDSLWEN